MPEPFLSDFTDADGCYVRVAHRLGAAARSAEHPFHLATVATVGPDRYPHARVVRVRGFDPADRTVEFHTDCRSPKVRHVAAEPRVSLVFYDRAARIQLRIPAVARLHHCDDAARSAWEALPAEDRALYAGADGPGEWIEPDAPLALPPPPGDDDSDAFDHFVVVECHFDAIDVFELLPGSHRRVRLTWDANGLRTDRLAP